MVHKSPFYTFFVHLRGAVWGEQTALSTRLKLLKETGESLKKLPPPPPPSLSQNLETTFSG